MMKDCNSHIENVDGKAPVFTDPRNAFRYGSIFVSAEFSDEALKLLPQLEPLRGQRVKVSAHQVVRNVRHGEDELLFMVSAPGEADWLLYGGTYFARALTGLSTSAIEQPDMPAGPAVSESIHSPIYIN